MAATTTGIAPVTNPQMPTLQSATPGMTAVPAGSMMNSVSTPPTGGPQDAGAQTIPMSPAPPVPPQGTFDAGSNSINSVINGPAPTTTAPQTSNFGTGAITAGGSPQSDPNFQNYTSGFNNALSNISNGPNRTQLAMQTLQDFDTAGQPQLASDFRNVGQQAAKFGRLGAGMTTNDLTGLQGTYDRNKMLLKNQLASSVAEGDINDRYRTADAYSGARAQQYGFGQDQRNYNTGVDQYNQGALFDRQQAGNSAQNAYQDRQFSQGQAQADAQRGERGYQYGLSQDAQNSAVQQKMLEDQLLNSAFGRSQGQLSAGEAGNPSGLLDSFGQQASGEAGDLYGAAGGLFGNIGKNSQNDATNALLQQILAQRQAGAPTG